jgi:hypothetical protein
MQNWYRNICIYYIILGMFRTLTRALNMFSMKNRYYNTSDNRLLATHISKYSVSRIELLCCNAAKNKCECVRTCKRFEPLEMIEKNFKCEITNKPPRTGDVDCKCEIMCMVKKSETMTIMENK